MARHGRNNTPWGRGKEQYGVGARSSMLRAFNYAEGSNASNVRTSIATLLQ